MDDYREIGPPGNGKTRKPRASSLAAVRETARHVELHANHVIFRGALYLRGISSGDFSEALAALLGAQAPGLSASTIGRLKEVWQDEMERWQRRDLSAKRYVYFWVDGIYFGARLEEEKQCILVIIGATDHGTKELIAITDGYRESEQSWREVLLDLKRRGLGIGPELVTGDGALGFWKALRQVYGAAREQRCWVHKTGNILNKLPKGLQNKGGAGSDTGSRAGFFLAVGAGFLLLLRRFLLTGMETSRGVHRRVPA